MSLLNINIGGEDDDGRAAGDDSHVEADNSYITGEQHEELVRLIKEASADQHRFLEYVQAASLADVRKTNFSKGRSMLLQKIERNRTSGNRG